MSRKAEDGAANDGYSAVADRSQRPKRETHDLGDFLASFLAGGANIEL